MRNEYGKMDKGRMILSRVRILICICMAVSIVYIMKDSLKNSFKEESVSVNAEDSSISEATFDETYYKEMMHRKEIVDNYLETVKKSNYMMHALGGMDGDDTYINSLDAMKYHYKRGSRLFEVDINFTADNRLVLCHGWKKKDFKRHVGIEYYDEDSANEDGEYILTRDEFLEKKIRGKYTTNTFEELVEFMDEHKDVYVMIDLAKKSYEDTLEIYNKIVSIVGDDDILQRFIVGGQTKDMVKAVKESYDFSIYNVAYSKEEFDGVDEFIEYCEKKSITSFGIASNGDRSELDELLEKTDMPSYVFTENDKDKADELLEKGVSVVGTDFLE